MTLFPFIYAYHTIVSKNAFFSDSPGSTVILWLIISKNEKLLLKIRKKMFPNISGP